MFPRFLRSDIGARTVEYALIASLVSAAGAAALLSAVAMA